MIEKIIDFKKTIEEISKNGKAIAKTVIQDGKEFLDKTVQTINEEMLSPEERLDKIRELVGKMEGNPDEILAKVQNLVGVKTYDAQEVKRVLETYLDEYNSASPLANFEEIKTKILGLVDSGDYTKVMKAQELCREATRLGLKARFGLNRAYELFKEASELG